MKYREVKPIINTPDRKTDIEGKYVVIAPHASAHAKYWMYPKGWQTVIDYLNSKDYKVVMLTQEPLGDEWHDSKLGGTLTGVINKTGDFPLEDRMVVIRDADAFIGVGVLGWHTFLQDKNIPFVGIQANAMTRKIFGFIQEEVLKASRNQATEYGEPEWCNPIYTN